MAQPDLQRPSGPHSTVQSFSLTVLPPAVHRFLFSQSEEYVVAHLFLRALFGAVSGTVLFLGVAHSLRLTFDLKLAAGCVFVGVCIMGGALSSSFRCSVLLMFPSMLGSRGRAYLMLLLLSVLYRGPVANIQRNVEAAALSLSCNLDLQVHHSKLVWRDAVRPFVLITQQLVDDKAGFESEALSVGRKFQTIRDEVVLQYGYERFRQEHAESGNSTQDRFTTKTMMQCHSVVDEGVRRCSDWFRLRWEECMEAIPVPIINHILCVSMKFHFLCDVMRVMTPWCREQVPVEGNFGQLFDRLNLSVDLLSREFGAKLVLQVGTSPHRLSSEQQQQVVLGGALMDQELTQSVRGSFRKLTAAMDRVLDVVQLLLSLTFVTIFTQAFGYLRQYRRDIRFDNVYITTYFRRIDARRRRAGKRCLLPLKRTETELIDPQSLKIHPEELRQAISGVFQVLLVSLLCVVLLTVDFSLFHVLDIVSRHSFTQFNLSSSHQVDIRVGGTSMMAHLLRKTISAFNSSSSLNIHTDNQGCVSPPSSLSAGVYVSCVCCVLLVVLFSCLQVYTNRLRRVIAAFYHPQREKKRVLFLYNLQIQRRISSVDDKRITRLGRRMRTVLQRLSRWGRHLCRDRRQKESDSEQPRYDRG
ncbi:E3 ubiquitin-protein ligase DCST1 [Toxotes jaculatrix]|uniref:E3 ubiquitin-protein ligase DCST1 n=1 Tax=Toxotes jaculatrix TaxID=941984 RepID=UPI001B3AF919|nr:E3 ubiquitin-protein ligase DCST1 [Toxotes jaculatrix]